MKQAMRLVCQLQKSQNLEEEAKTLSSRLRGQLEGLHGMFLAHKLKAWQDRAKSPNTQVFRVWKSNANALRLLGEEAGASKAPRKKKNKQKKQKEQKEQQEQACARTSEAGVLEAGCEKREESEDLAAGGVPDKARDKAPDSGPAQEVPSSGEDHDARDATDECCVCMDAPKHFMFAPCGHRCACEACAKDVMSTTRECPMCRAAASHIFKVFL